MGYKWLPQKGWTRSNYSAIKRWRHPLAEIRLAFTPVKVSKAEQIAFTQNTKISTRIASKVVLLIDVKKGFLLF